MLNDTTKINILGGIYNTKDPLDPINREDILEFILMLKKDPRNKNKAFWLYTDYKYEQLVFEGNFTISQILKNVDVLVEREKFIDVQKSLKSGYTTQFDL